MLSKFSAGQPHARALIREAQAAVQQIFADARLGRPPDLALARRVVADLDAAVTDAPDTLLSLLRRKTPEQYTHLHSVAVCALMMAMARHLKMPEALVREAGLGGLLHDIGKAQVPEALLAKPAELTEEELILLRAHPARAHALLRRGGELSEDVLDICLHHHERIDGSGYPQRLQRNEISLLAKLAAVADVYDAITSERPYKSAMAAGEALRVMSQWSRQLDPGAFHALVCTVGIHPVGSLVRLQTGRLAVVLRRNPASLMAPWVKVFYCTRSNEPLPEQEINLGLLDSDDRIVAFETSAAWSFSNLDRLWAEEMSPA